MISQDLCTELHGQLESDRARLQGEIEHIRAVGIKAGEFDADEKDTYDQHPADQGSELFEREKNMSVMHILQEQLDGVEAALQRFEEGTYGLCESCGQPISEARLRAFPAATHCIECQGKIDRGELPVTQ